MTGPICCSKVRAPRDEQHAEDDVGDRGDHGHDGGDAHRAGGGQPPTQRPDHRRKGRELDRPEDVVEMAQREAAQPYAVGVQRKEADQGTHPRAGRRPR